jgi:capsular exopolysaccharide synthesis family protein
VAEQLRVAEGAPRPYRRESIAEQPIEVRRHLDALRRSRKLILAIVVAFTGTVFALSWFLPETYRAQARIVMQDTPGLLRSSDADSLQRRLETIETLLTTPAVLRQAAGLVGESEERLEDKVSASADSNANIINVAATDRQASNAAAIANAVANVFLEEQADVERERLQRARSSLFLALSDVIDRPDAAVQEQAIREQLSELRVSEAAAGSELQLAQPASVPSDPHTPRPVRNTILALFASIFLGVLVAIGRDQLVPRVGGPRELSRLTDLPVLIGIPYVRRRLKSLKKLSAIEHEAYQTLQATIRFQLPSERQHVILVTSALEQEGKTKVTASLGRALARAGQKTLLISADMRGPRLHEVFDSEQSPGFSELLAILAHDPGASPRDLLEDLVRVQRNANLHVLPSGARPSNPAQLLSGDALGRVFDAVYTMDYGYVVVDGPPLLGLADSHLLAQRVEDLLMVARLDRLTVDNVIEMRELFDRMDVNPLGVVVIGAQRGVSPSYLSSSPRAVEDS